MSVNTGTPKRSKRKLILIGAGVFSALCLLCLAIGLIYGNTPGYKATQAANTAAAVAQAATRAALPTSTATSTPEPTATPAPTDTPAPTTTKDPNNLETSEQVAFIGLAKEAVLKVLKSPSTAKFPGLLLEADQWRIGKHGDIVSLVSWVDAQNSFGAMIRSDFAMQFSYSTKELLYMQFAGEEVYGTFHEIK